MSAEARPITPRSFSRALEDLTVPSLYLKVVEMQNSIAHLHYSNEQLKPFAEGAPADDGAAATEPDQDCIDAIRENEEVLVRMGQRIELVRAELEKRGFDLKTLPSKEEVDELAANGRAVGRAEAEAARALMNGANRSRQADDGVDEAEEDGGEAATGAGQPAVNGAAGIPRSERTHPAWSDGTFQTGTIRNGELRMDGPGGVDVEESNTRGTGGRRTDEELRRAIEQITRQMEEQDSGDEGGLHL